MPRNLTEKQVAAQTGGRKLNPERIDEALNVLRGMYLGFIYPYSFSEKIRTNALIPINKLLLDPDLADKISDEIGPVSLPVLQHMIEQAAPAVDRVADVTNKIIGIQNRLASTAYPPYPGLPKVRVPKLPAPFTGKFMDGATQLFFMDTIHENERKREKDERVRLIGADLPADNAGEMVKHVAKIMGESQWLAQKLGPNVMSPSGIMKGMTYAGLVDSNEFKNYQAKLHASIDKEHGDLEKSEVFQKYKKSWPVLGDSIMAAFVGAPVTLAYMPIREIATIGLLAAEDPAVKKIAYDISTGSNTDDSTWHNLFKEVNRTITDQINTGGYSQARILPEIVTQSVLTAPAVWDKLGIQNPTTNYVWEGMKGLKWGTRNLRQRMENGVFKKTLEFFEDKNQLGYEQMRGKFTDYLDQVLGPKYGKELTGKLKEKFDASLSNMVNSTKDRSLMAADWRQKVLGMVQSRFAVLTDVEKQAAILKVQTGKAMKAGKPFDGYIEATDEVRAVWNNDLVDDTVGYIRTRMEKTRLFDPNLPEDPYYFPAWRVFGEDNTKLFETYAARGYAMEREFTEAVIPTASTLTQNMINFADRIAAPQAMSFLNDRVTNARTAASAAMKIVAEGVENPERYIDDLAAKFREVAFPKLSKAQLNRNTMNRLYSEFQNTILLTSRAGDWMKRNVFDDTVRFGMNMWDNFKEGKIPTRASLQEALTKEMPPELYDGMFSRVLLDDADPYAMTHLSQMKSGYNETIFGYAQMLQQKALNITGKVNYAAEKSAYMLEKGVTELDDIGERIVMGKAMEKSRDYMLANEANSAFSSNLGTKLILSYTGFFLKSSELIAKELGRSPELFTAGAALANQMRDANENNPEWDKYKVTAFGRQFSDVNSLSMWPIVKTISQLDFNVLKQDPDSKIGRDLEMLKSLPTTAQKDVLANRADLRNYDAWSGMKAIGSAVQTMMDLNVVPIGVGAQFALNYAKVIKQRTPYWMIGSKQLGQFAKAIGWDSVSVEGRLNKMVGAYEQNLFDYGARQEYIKMVIKGEIPKGMSEEDARQMATDKYKTEQMRDLLFNRYFGMGKKLDPVIQDFNNALSEYFGARENVTPTPAQLEEVKATTGIRNDDQAEFIWKSGQLFSLDARAAAVPYRQKLLEQYPEIPEMAKLLRDRRQLQVYLGLKETDDIAGRAPVNLDGEIKKGDKIYQAFLRLHQGTSVPDERGNPIYKFDGNKSVGDMFAEWSFATPAERNELIKKPEMDYVVKNLDPGNYDKYQLIKNKEFAIPRDQTIEDDYRQEQTTTLSDVIKGAADFLPNGAPMDIFDTFLGEDGSAIKPFVDKAKSYAPKVLDAINKAGDFLMRPLVANVEAADGFEYGDDAEREKFKNPTTTIDRSASQRAKEIKEEYDNMVAKMPARPTISDNKKKADFFQERVVNGDPQVSRAFKALYPQISAAQIPEPITGNGDDVVGQVVGFSQSAQVSGYVSSLYAVLSDPTADVDTYRDALARGQVKVLGRPILDYVRKNGNQRALVATLEHKAAGNQYRMGYERIPNFDLNKPEEARAFQVYKELNFSRPDESLGQYQERVRATVSDKAAWPDAAFIQYTDILKKKGAGETATIFSSLRQGLFKPIPLDQRTQAKIQAFRDEMPFIEDDRAALTQRLAEDPELTNNILHYEPRLYRSLQNKLFSPYDKGWKAYAQSSQYAPESINYMRRLAPQAYSRLYWKDADFRARVDTLGYAPPAPSAETSVTRSYTDGNGVVHNQTIPDVLAPPEPINPDPVPRGTFSSLPSLLLYTAQNSRDEVFRINAFKQSQRKKGESDRELDTRFAREFPSDNAFLRAPHQERVFQRFPAVIGQGFREGQLGPDEVIQNLKGVSDFANIEGFISPEQHQSFGNFLNTTSNVFGATRFGFQMGAFLDETFNIPRIPVSSATLDFFLAGQPVSSIPKPISTTQATTLMNIGDLRNSYRAQLPQFNNIPTAPIPAGDSIAPPPQSSAVAEAGASGAGAASAVATGSGLPVVGAVFAVVSAGFAIYNAVKSKSQRRRAKQEAGRARERQIQEAARAQAESRAATDEAGNRQLADENFRRLQSEDAARQKDFRQRLSQVLAEGVSFASLAQQPKEFVNSFVDQFEPEAVEFTNRPQLDSRVGLIRQIQAKLPKARY